MCTKLGLIPTTAQTWHDHMPVMPGGVEAGGSEVQGCPQIHQRL